MARSFGNYDVVTEVRTVAPLTYEQVEVVLRDFTGLTAEEKSAYDIQRGRTPGGEMVKFVVKVAGQREERSDLHATAKVLAMLARAYERLAQHEDLLTRK